jgi:NAD+ synthase (glutamine-hydrolysing)
MRLIRIGIGNADPTVGAFRANTDQAIGLAREMSAAGCMVGVLSEQIISGYPAEDLVQWQGFVDKQWTELLRFAEETSECFAVFALGVTVEEGGCLYNCAAIVSNGNILGLVPKEKLPTYGVFFDDRTFSRGVPHRVTSVRGVPFGDLVFRFPFGVLAAEVCEDIWSPDGPMRRRAYSGAELILNVSASPFRSGVLGTRREMISTRAADNCATIAYANQLGGNDALVFDGGGFVNQGGRMMLEAPRWRQGISTVVVDLDRTARQRKENTTWRFDRQTFLGEGREVKVLDFNDDVHPGHDPDLAYPLGATKSFFLPADEPGPNPRDLYFQDLLEAITWGLGGYFEKTRAFRTIGISLSGGKDSALVLLVAYLFAARKFKDQPLAVRDLIRCFSMPTHFNSETTKGIAKRLCDALGVSFREIPVERVVEVNHSLAGMMGEAAGIPAIAAQNVQARTRGSAMWNWTNIDQGMWLQTSNMSEKSVGYTTIGGDMMGAYSLIGNMPKTVVIALLNALVESAELRKKFPEFPDEAIEVIRDLMRTKASAELAENQEDERDLMCRSPCSMPASRFSPVRNSCRKRSKR